MLPSAHKLYGDALWRCFMDFMDFSTCPHWQHHFQVLCWPWYYCAWLASHHAWPEAHLESMGYLQEKDEKQWIQQSRRAEDSIVPHQSHRLIASITDAGARAEGATAKYWVQKSNILIFWDTDFWLSWAVSSNHQKSIQINFWNV